jgi:acetate CoA/acetoacetate CoA-transferase beta subunit
VEDAKEFIAKRVAQELRDGDVVNLGIGLPTLVSNYVPDNVHIILHSENGIVGTGPKPDAKDATPYIVDAGGNPASVMPGGAFIDSCVSFGIVRGGHVDVTILGALEVDRNGNISNWIIPSKKIPGMGGAMDLVVGAKKVIVAMEHTSKGNHKILEDCILPLTAVGAVDMIITEMGVMEVIEVGLKLTEYNPEYTLHQIQVATGCPLIIGKDIKPMTI